MSFGNFTLHRPASLSEACTLSLRLGRAAAFLAGGTDLLVDLRSGRRTVDHVIALGGLTELSQVRRDGDRLALGALASLADIAADPVVREGAPVLPEAISHMAGRQIRNLATIGGNFCCGVPCSDTPPVLCALGAELVIAGPERERTVAAREFILAPRVTMLEPGEIMREIRVPVMTAGTGAAFQRFTMRQGSALAVAAVTAWLRLDGDKIGEVRLTMGAVGPVPLFAEKAAASLAGRKPGDDAFAAAGALAAEEAQPISDLRGSEQYRRDVVAVLTARALTTAAQRARGGAA